MLFFSWISKMLLKSKIFFPLMNTIVQVKMLSQKPDKILEHTLKSYEHIVALQLFGSKTYITQGFNPAEQTLYNKYISKIGTILAIGCGAGRETIEFAKRGHTVIGVDFIQDLIRIGKMWADRLNLNITYEEQDICSYTPPENFFDFITFTIYPLIPTRASRLSILHKLRNSLKDSGLLFIYFQKRITADYRLKNKHIAWLLKIINPLYEYGDYMGYAVFIHHFEEQEIRDEVRHAGFDIVEVCYGDYAVAALKKCGSKNEDSIHTRSIS